MRGVEIDAYAAVVISPFKAHHHRLGEASIYQTFGEAQLEPDILSTRREHQSSFNDQHVRPGLAHLFTHIVWPRNLAYYGTRTERFGGYDAVHAGCGGSDDVCV